MTANIKTPQYTAGQDAAYMATVRREAAAAYEVYTAASAKNYPVTPPNYAEATKAAFVNAYIDALPYAYEAVKAETAYDASAPEDYYEDVMMSAAREAADEVAVAVAAAYMAARFKAQ